MNALITRPPQKRYTIEDFATLFDASAVLPNFEPLPLWRVAKMATSFYGQLVEGKKARTDEKQGRWQDTLYLLAVGQGGGLTGEGYVIVRQGWQDDDSSVVGGRFAICKHEKVEGPGANHARGWHPGWCGKCGLDMSVDSGD